MMKSRYQKLATNISITLSISFFILSAFFTLAPSFTLQFLFHHDETTNPNHDNFSPLERTLVVLLGGILASFSLVTILLRSNIVYCRFVLATQIVIGFMSILASIQSTGVENEDHVEAYPVLVGGCFVFILSSSGFMVSFCHDASYSDLDIDFSEELFADTSSSLYTTSSCCWNIFSFSELRNQTFPLLPLGSTDTTEGESTPSNNSDSQSSLHTPPQTRIHGTRRILKLASPQKLTLVLGCLVLLIRLPFSLSIPHLVSSTIGSLSRNDYDAAKRDILRIMILGTVDAILDFWCVYLFGGAKERMVKSLRLDTFHSILHQEIAFFDNIHTGELTSRLTSDCGEMAGDLTWFFRFSIEATVRITGISLYMLIRCPVLGLTALSIIPVVAFTNKQYGNWLAKNATQVQSALAEANNVAQEALSCIRTVIAFATEDVEHDKYKEKIEFHFQLNMRQVCFFM